MSIRDLDRDELMALAQVTYEKRTGRRRTSSPSELAGRSFKNAGAKTP